MLPSINQLNIFNRTRISQRFAIQHLDPQPCPLPRSCWLCFPLFRNLLSPYHQRKVTVHKYFEKCSNFSPPLNISCFFFFRDTDQHQLWCQLLQMSRTIVLTVFFYTFLFGMIFRCIHHQVLCRTNVCGTNILWQSNIL